MIWILLTNVLENLEKKGFIMMKIGKPIKYIAINRYRPFVKWLFANYKKLEMVGDVAIFVPVSPGADQKGIPDNGRTQNNKPGPVPGRRRR